MKPLTIAILTAILTLSLLPEAADAKGTRRRVVRSGGPPGGGVVLSTPNPTDPLSHNNRGVELGSKGLWEDAIREHEMALVDAPLSQTFRQNLSGAHLRYGDILSGKKKYYEAIKQYVSALYVDPNNVPADEHLDRCYQAIGKDALDAKYRERLGEEADIHGNYEEAIVQYRKLVRMRDDGPAHAALGRVLLKAGKPVDGYAELRIAVGKTWEGKDKNDLAACHRQLGQLLYDYALTAKNRGKGTLGMKRLWNAIIELRRAVTINPADGTALQLLVECSREGVAIQATFDNYLMLGGAYLLAGDFAHAKLCYEQCFKLDPRNPALGAARVAFHQAVARSPLASPELVAESITKVNKFLESDPDNARFLYILGRLKEHQGDTVGSMDDYRRAEKINPLIDPDLAVGIKRLGGQSSAPAFAGAPGFTPGASTQGGGGAAPGTTGTTTAQAPAQPPKPAIDPRREETYAKVESMLSVNPDEALKVLDEYIPNNKDDAHAYTLKGRVLEKKGDLDTAAAMYRLASSFKDEDAQSALDQVNLIRVQPHIKRFEECKKEGNWVGAASEMREAIVKAAELAILHRYLSEALTGLKDSVGAQKELEKAKELESPKKKNAVGKVGEQN